jgi:hypothetical protein
MKQDPKFIVVLVLLIATLAYTFIWQGNMADKSEQKSAQNFTAQSIQVVTGTWSSDELQKRAHPLLMQGVKESGNSMSEYFKVLSQLGELKKGPECNFLSMAKVTTAKEHFISASHLCAVEYSHAQATIGVEVRKDNMSGPWQIVNFQVNSPFFSQKSGNPKEDTKPKTE